MLFKQKVLILLNQLAVDITRVKKLTVNNYGKAKVNKERHTSYKGLTA